MAEIKQYRCDICGKVGDWTTSWRSITYLISRKLVWEHEFHVCSDACEKKLDTYSKAERKKLAWEAGKIK